MEDLSATLKNFSAHIAEAATVPEHLIDNFELYFRGVVAACHQKAQALPRPQRCSSKLFLEFHQCS